MIYKLLKMNQNLKKQINSTFRHIDELEKLNTDMKNIMNSEQINCDQAFYILKQMKEHLEMLSYKYDKIIPKSYDTSTETNNELYIVSGILICTGITYGLFYLYK